MTNVIENNDSDWLIKENERLVTVFKENRTNSITVTELCRRICTQRITVYRIENGTVDPKLSTLINYLHGFGYHLEVVPDIPRPDFVVEDDGVKVQVEQFDSKKSFPDRRTRIAVLKHMLDELEAEEDM